ncbi:DUF4197 domain-containing protein [soil metagenome]
MKTILMSIMTMMVINIMSFAQIGNLKDKLKSAIQGDQSEVASGLKEALEKGVNKGTDMLSLSDGYYKSIYKIWLPEEAQTVVKRLKSVPGFANLEDDLVERLNRAAEDAASKAKPIFKKAITSMTIGDAMSILMGEKNAATLYLHKVTYDDLYREFIPVIRQSLNTVNANELWEAAMTAYNRIPLVQKVNPKLDDYVTHKALDGLFGMIEKEELEIRTNARARSSELLKKVFAQQDKK